MSNKPVSVARTKTKNVQREMRVAVADLHHSNDVLAKSGNGEPVPDKAVQAAVARNVDVEEKLHDAVQELESVSELLSVAEAKNAEHDDQNMVGRRSGVGLESVMQQMSTSAHRKPPRDADPAVAAPAKQVAARG